MQKPLRTPKIIELEADKRMAALRASLPPTQQALPTMAELYRRYGEDWLTYDSAYNMRYLAPWPCTKCGSNVARVGNATCADCYSDIIVLPPAPRNKSDTTDAVTVTVSPHVSE